MNFFEHQQRARQNTTYLVVLFTISVIVIITLSTILLAGIFWGIDAQSTGYNPNITVSTGYFSHLTWPLALKIGLAVTLVISLAIYFKYLSLRSGGAAIAEQLGGKPILHSTGNLSEKQLLNIVEEMAIASGMPVPVVYRLEDTSINAFAAGMREEDAVIGVTRGAIERLNRDQLQGVIAHEFSHILHGDSRLNMSLIIVLSGILFLSTAGRLILGSSRRSNLRYARGKNGAPVFFLGVGLVVLGYIGTLFGNLIKAAVSRQREFLADASAVQYTRNPAGIGEALRVIGGSGAGSVLLSPRTQECSHLFFGDAVGFRAVSLMATHPPLTQRIRRIDPHWDGTYLSGRPIQSAPKIKTRQRFERGLSSLQDSLTGTGVLDAVMLMIADELLRSIPGPLYKATQEPAAATALMYALRISTQQRTRNAQWTLLSKDETICSETQHLLSSVMSMDAAYVLPLVELSIPALKTLSSNQYQHMKNTLASLIAADQKTDYKEWLHYRLLCHYLDNHFSGQPKLRARSFHGWHQVHTAVVEIFSLLAWFSGDTPEIAQRSFNNAIGILKINNAKLRAEHELTMETVNQSLKRLEDLVPLLKEKFLQACAGGIRQDQKVTHMEWDLLRVLSACMGCPMPLISRPVP